jgi:1-acyl-sn-glycerol-3-phosphate acyltransferase
LGTTFVERVDPTRGVEDTRHLAQQLGRGRALIWFAEGTFDRRPGLRSFELGAFVVAAQLAVPVIPAGINGTRSMLRAESAFPRRGLVTVAIGPPIPSDGSDWAAALRLRDRTRVAVLERCGEPDLVYELKPI